MDYRDAVHRAGVLVALAEYDPHVAGTLPLKLDLPTSDIDVLCHAPDPHRFTSSLWQSFGSWSHFRIWQWSNAGRPIVASFVAHGWTFEIFGQARPVAEQMGWRHFVVEKRLLALGGQRLAASVMSLRQNGLKTEPAFATVLKLQGDPYQALNDLYDFDNKALLRLIVD